MRIIAGRVVRPDIIEKDGAFIKERLGQLNALFGTSWKKAPTWVGIRRFLLKLDATQVEEVVRLHAESRCLRSREYSSLRSMAKRCEEVRRV
jgi:hypothetical protein